MKLLRSRFEKKKKIVEKALYSFVNISIDYRDLQLIFCHEKKIFNSNEMEKITIDIPPPVQQESHGQIITD